MSIRKLSNTTASNFSEVYKGGKEFLKGTYNSAKNWAQDHKSELLGTAAVIASVVLAATGNGIVDGHLAESAQTMVGTGFGIASGIFTAVAHGGKQEAARLSKISGMERE